ncbi:hypothetical protein [Chelatococcus sambhunathii]|uniref:hypothetical protein n=1 Tax=Chelatococcus sambhunathii TaxID=363953 RepID=UPI002852C516|nr:hypothetical protein [Chelatococcus sambhunathii]
MASGRGIGRRLGGVLAAYLLVLQAVLTGLALGAAPVAADPFSVLCRTDAAAPQETPAKSGHKALPDCCVAGCAMFGGGMAPPPDAAASIGAHASQVLAPAAVQADVARAAADRSSHHPRGPPVRI